MKGVIYCYHCMSTGLKYIGQTIDEKQRKRTHSSYYKMVNNNNNKFINSLKLYGIENFIYGVIEESDASLLDERESYYINKYNTMM